MHTGLHRSGPLLFFPAQGAESLLPAILVLAVWASDTAAYFIGKKFGKKRLAPHISPRKTWAGLLAAMAGGVALIFVFGSVLRTGMGECVLVGALIGLLGQLGDILESVFKRVHGVKDSSSLIPGHGRSRSTESTAFFTVPFYHYRPGFPDEETDSGYWLNRLNRQINA
jgi:phosphatidate cytidylyltransferase